MVLEVEKLFETRYLGRTLQVRGIRYLYVVWVRGRNLVLKYHNVHEDPDKFVHRVYDRETGKEIFYEALTRFQFPVFTDVLDEAEILTRSSAR